MFPNLFAKKEKNKSSELNNDSVDVIWTEDDKTLLQSIWKQTSLPEKEFDIVYKPFLQNVFEYLYHAPQQRVNGVQHHDIKRDILILVNLALRIRRARIIPKQLSPEDTSYLHEVMTFVVMIYVVLEQVGRIARRIELNSLQADVWRPFLENIPANTRINKCELFPVNYSLMFLPKLMNKEGQSWLAGKPQAMNY